MYVFKNRKFGIAASQLVLCCGTQVGDSLLCVCARAVCVCVCVIIAKSLACEDKTE